MVNHCSNQDWMIVKYELSILYGCDHSLSMIYAFLENTQFQPTINMMNGPWRLPDHLVAFTNDRIWQNVLVSARSWTIVMARLLIDRIRQIPKAKEQRIGDFFLHTWSFLTSTAEFCVDRWSAWSGAVHRDAWRVTAWRCDLIQSLTLWLGRAATQSFPLECVFPPPSESVMQSAGLALTSTITTSAPAPLLANNH